MAIPIWSVASVFFIFSKGRLQKVKKLTKNVGKNSVHVFTRCACTRACAMLRAYLICLGDKSFHLVKVWWRSEVILLSHDPLKKCNRRTSGQAKGQASKQANNCQIYIRMEHNIPLFIKPLYTFNLKTLADFNWPLFILVDCW